MDQVIRSTHELQLSVDGYDTRQSALPKSQPDSSPFQVGISKIFALKKKEEEKTLEFREFRRPCIIQNDVA